MTDAPQAPHWREALAPFARPSLRLSALDLATSVVPYVALTLLAYAVRDSSTLLVLLLAVPTAGFLLRTYILFHDCTHGSFLPSKRANAWLGAALGLVVWSPFASWKHNHQIHHATAGDLDRRGTGDVPTLTVDEWNALDRRGRLAYWLFRHPAVMFGIGPIWAMVVQPRFVRRSMRPRVRRSVIATNVALLLVVGTTVAVVGPLDYLLVQGLPIWLAAAAGVWLFYVQHQFEDTYWQDADAWDYDEAALRGSSHLVLPQPLQFFSGNIGLHHVHHLSARIPNYFLQRANDAHPALQAVPKLSIRQGMRAVRLKLWDPRAGRLVTFADARRQRRPEAALAVTG